MNAQFQFCFYKVVTTNVGNDTVWVKKDMNNTSLL